MSKWIGYAVSVNCGEPLGCYQGTILAADGSTLTLSKAFRNGFPYPKSQVTLNAADIRSLRIIETGAVAAPAHSTVPINSTRGKKPARATVCENLQASPATGVVASSVEAPSSSGGGGAPPALPAPPRHKPSTHNQPGMGGYAASRGGVVASGGGDKARRKNEACFGSAADAEMGGEFDFEGNLALFDKRALWERMRGARQPDVVPGSRYRHDENVLGGGGGAAAAGCAASVPEGMRGPRTYVTDEGVRVDSVSERGRRALWGALGRCAGGAGDVARALLARATCDVALRLAGGGRRLEARNAHQAPCAVVLCGAHEAGAAGLLAARLLCAHGARVHVSVSGDCGVVAHESTSRELAALAEAGVRPEPLAGLPRADVVVVALHDVCGAGAGADEVGVSVCAALRWAGSARGCVVAVEPPGSGACAEWEGVCARASLQALLPGALSPHLGRVYLANVAPPPHLFTALGIEYRPPFGAAHVLPLHHDEQEQQAH